MALLGCIFVVLTCVCYCLAAVRYDQSQSGDYNIHIDLKNIEVLAILDDGSFVGEYDDYDYDQLTERPKPPHPDANSTYITPPNVLVHVKPNPAGCSNSTTKSNATLECANSTESSAGNGTASTPSTGGDAPKPTPASNYTTSHESIALVTDSVISTNSTQPGDDVATSTGKPVRRCGSGFYRDVLGRCRRIRRPFIPLLGLGYPPRASKAESGTPPPRK